MALQQARIAADRIHADRAQKLRDGALEAFARLGSGKIIQILLNHGSGLAPNFQCPCL